MRILLAASSSLAAGSKRMSVCSLASSSSSPRARANNHSTELCSGSEAGSYLRLIDWCITQLKAHGPSRTCNESKEEEDEGHHTLLAASSRAAARSNRMSVCSLASSSSSPVNPRARAPPPVTVQGRFGAGEAEGRAGKMQKALPR